MEQATEGGSGVIAGPLAHRPLLGSGHGWLVTADEASNLHLLNPITGGPGRAPARHRAPQRQDGHGRAGRPRVRRLRRAGLRADHPGDRPGARLHARPGGALGQPLRQPRLRRAPPAHADG
ncbi:hypothetical protein GQ55_8G218200 [Panicum hallii var. hallii]|uniref:Uncharacterized protein n=1 Tax=Panicum hallii var. hallii TaxID=1504633 RepID=A0A2T7CPW3_9POAL|nr:hypothetical protein GQ55_8G218200 [Panicum hallii var. hallii]